MAAGIVLADAWPDSRTLTAGVLGLGLLLLRFGREKTQVLLPWLLCFSFGWLTHVLHTTIYTRDDLRILLTDKPQIVTLEGRIDSLPNEKTVQTKQSQRKHFTTTLAVQRMLRGQAWCAASGTVYIQASSARPAALHLGTSVQVTGVLAPPPPAGAPGLFDFQQHLARQDIYFLLHTSKEADWSCAAEAQTALCWTEQFHHWARQTLQAHLPPEDEHVRLIQAMALGWKGGLTEELSASFVQTGTMHLFAISGLHVALIALILVELARCFHLPRWACAVIVLPLLWFYTAATGWQASAIRATIMATVICAGWVLERPSNMLNSLAASACLILLYDPQQLFQAGFQLSFLVVLSMGILSPIFESWRQRLIAPDPFLPEELRPRWRRWLDLPLNFVTVCLVTSLSAWLGSLPLIAYYFHIITPVSLLANLVLVPLSSLVLMANVGSLLFAWLPPALELFNLCGWGVMRLMVEGSDIFSRLPLGWWHLAAPSLPAMLLYYALLLTAFATGWKSNWRWGMICLTGLSLTGVLWFSWWQQQQRVALTILDVRGGDAHWFTGGKHHPSLLVDTGSAESYNFTLKPFLLSQGVQTVPDVLLTHGDVRHIGAATNLTADFHTEKLITSRVPSRSSGYRQLATNWPGQHLLVGAGTHLSPWQVLHPGPQDQFTAGDDNAIVLFAEIHGVKLLLLSDLGRNGQRALLARYPDLQADIVVSGLPAKDEPLGETLLAALKPQAVIVTCAWQPAAEQASPDLMTRLKQTGSHTFFLQETGTISLQFTPDGVTLQAMRGINKTLTLKGKTAPVSSQ